MTKRRIIILCLFAYFSYSRIVDAQCYSDAGKHTCFRYENMQAYFSNSSGADAKDFATSVLNPNTNSLYTVTQLRADDRRFEYEPTCYNPMEDGRCVYVYQYPPRYYNGYSQTERWVGNAQNIIGVSLPGCDDNATFTWTGKVEIYSVALNGVPVRPFYSFSTQKFTTPNGMGSSMCQAYHNAWNAWESNIDVTWDGDIQRLVVPYANFWHNKNEWPYGWQTSVYVYNGTGILQTYHLENHLSGGDHGGDGGGACSLNNEGEIETSFSLLNGEEIYIDPFRFHISDDVASAHDTVLFIRVDGTPVGGNNVSANVYVNTSGSQMCP